MSFALIIMFVAVFALVSGAGLVGFMLGRRQPTPLGAPTRDQGIPGQAERLELLENELQRVKDQADFTERLLAERGGALPSDPRDADTLDQ